MHRQISKTAGPVFYDFQDAVNALTFGVGEVGFDKWQDIFFMSLKGLDELAQRLQPALQCSCRPFL